ncbi:hypothetical protein SDRG_16603 [Saprolegnia diclina VS20]|uniref:RanBP2-type domain-containing protein n=1 Tax=Saprolegnia diclina (strain VS20) TaxID=1156394 RepID=T0PWY3_SAPDV|nr:hypothetical protein SDRG_16603 [Saprolegnia diclina VS20]EQC25520.1 hypothetical protein SDRG_16603 [Saprolegnia diclina VS20]|eukprot:XP_008621041.1 hypothetical protein SDRG_16603 [Saprolegnia diclina VS20]
MASTAAWECNGCGAKNVDSLYCVMCASPDPRKVLNSPTSVESWACAKCTVHYEAYAMACNLCNEPRPTMQAQGHFATDDSYGTAFDDTTEAEIATPPPPAEFDANPATPQPVDTSTWWSQDDDEMAVIQGGGSAKKTKAQVAYEAFCADPTQASIKTEDLRKSLRGPKLPPTYNKSHYFDVEVAKDVVVKEVLRRHRNGQPLPDFLTEIVPIQQALRHRSNWRPLLAIKNKINERLVAACVMNDEPAIASGHGLSKLVNAWQHIERTLGELGWAYDALRAAYAADHTSAAALDDATKDAFEGHVLQRLEKDGLLLRTADGRIDKRCAAVRSGDLTLKDDGTVDQRCSAYRAVLSSFSEATCD